MKAGPFEINDKDESVIRASELRPAEPVRIKSS
jgi:hypothetical protein